MLICVENPTTNRGPLGKSVRTRPRNTCQTDAKHELRGKASKPGWEVAEPMPARQNRTISDHEPLDAKHIVPVEQPAPDRDRNFQR